MNMNEELGDLLLLHVNFALLCQNLKDSNTVLYMVAYTHTFQFCYS